MTAHAAPKVRRGDLFWIEADESGGPFRAIRIPSAGGCMKGIAHLIVAKCSD